MMQHESSGWSARQSLPGDRNEKQSAVLEDRIRACARLRADDKPVFAANLGVLAGRVDPDDPLNGARRIVERSGIEGAWAKRKRYFRLPGETAPEAAKDSAYASSAVTFLSLAQAAGAILAPSGNPELVEIEKSRAVRLLAGGSSFLPAWAPSEPGEKSAKGLMDEYASRLLEKIDRETRLAEMWSGLRETPITLDAYDEDELKLAAPSQFGGSAEFPSELLYPHFRRQIVAARFVPGSVDLSWSEPALEIGHVTYTREVAMLVLPEKVRPWFADPEGDSALSPEAIRFLKAIRFGHFRIRDANNAVDGMLKSLGLGEALRVDRNAYGKASDDSPYWKFISINSTLKVALGIIQGDDRRPRLQVSTYGDESFAFGDSGLVCGYAGQNWGLVAEGDGRIIQQSYREAESGSLPGLQHGSVCVVHAAPFDRAASEEPPVVGVLEHGWNEEPEIGPLVHGVSGWTGDAETMDILIGNAATFRPALASCEPEAGALRQGSVGAALLHNALNGTAGNRVTDLLVERARLTADACLRFHDAMTETYREAIRRM